MAKTTFKYYDRDVRVPVLELSDRRLLWHIDFSDVEISEQEWNYWYSDICNYYTHLLNEHYHTDVYCLGRSGRHVCIDDTAHNRKIYRFIKDKVATYQDRIIKEANSFLEGLRALQNYAKEVK